MTHNQIDHGINAVIERYGDESASVAVALLQCHCAIAGIRMSESERLYAKRAAERLIAIRDKATPADV